MPSLVRHFDDLIVTTILRGSLEPSAMVFGFLIGAPSRRS